ncbi:hypothetical protein [Dapis sp. BLCC M229]
MAKPQRRAMSKATYRLGQRNLFFLTIVQENVILDKINKINRSSFP